MSDKERRRRRALNMRHAGRTHQEIADALGIPRSSVDAMKLPPVKRMWSKAERGNPKPEEYRYHIEERVLHGQRVQVPVFSDRPDDPHVLRRPMSSEEAIEMASRGGKATRRRSRR